MVDLATVSKMDIEIPCSEHMWPGPSTHLRVMTLQVSVEYQIADQNLKKIGEKLYWFRKKIR